jgi:hypothetical protein
VTQVRYLPNLQEDLCQRVTYGYDQYPTGDPLNYVAFNYPIGRLTRMSWSGGPGCSYGFQEEYTC